MKQRIAITGSSGMIASVLIPRLRKEGFDITRIFRPDTPGFADDIVRWNIETSHIEAAKLENHFAVIHLAGANIGAHRWTPEYKTLLFNSRMRGTHLLCEALAKLQNPPKVLLSASAVGIYGNHPSHVTLDEDSPTANDFLAGICRAWEAETIQAARAGIRVVNMRFGVVLSPQGGALKKMLVPFRLGVGGVIGSGRQVMSWIDIEEIPDIVLHLLNSRLQGPVNVVSPNAISNREFVKTLGSALRCPTVFPLPAFMVQALFGEMGKTLLLEGARVFPKCLTESGYRFRHAELADVFQRLV